MTTTHDNNLDRCDNCGRFGWHTTDRCPNATTWRDLADKLTPEQVTKLEGIERDPVGYFVHIGPPMSRSEVQAALLGMARRYAGDNLAGDLYADVPAPAGAVNVSDWADWDDDSAIRYFSGRRWVVDLGDPGKAIHIVADGTQVSNGHIDRAITLADKSPEGMTAEWNVITPQQARQFAAALIEAAAEADRLTLQSPGTESEMPRG